MLAIVGMFADFADVDGKKTQHGQFLKLSDHFHWPDERADQKLLETVDESVQALKWTFSRGSQELSTHISGCDVMILLRAVTVVKLKNMPTMCSRAFRAACESGLREGPASAGGRSGSAADRLCSR